MTTAIGEFDHIRPQFRGKVAADFLAHLTPDSRWDQLGFDSSNDYQRHLYALFLRIHGLSEDQVFAKIFVLSRDVSEGRRAKYVSDVLNSEIVGFNKGRILIPDIPHNAEAAQEGT